MSTDEHRFGGKARCFSPICVHLCSSVVALLAAVAGGCVERALTVESVPPGAEARVNGRRLGPTPVTVPFRHYGVYEIELRKEGFETLHAEESVTPRWYVRFPLGLVTELLWPGVIRDYRWLEYELRRPAIPDRAGLVRRAAEAEEGTGGP